MNVVDSSGWLEYFTAVLNTNFFSNAIENPNQLIVPTISIFEVFKKILHNNNENNAFKAIAVMRQGQVVALNFSLSLAAAKLSQTKKIPMVDRSCLLAHALMMPFYGLKTPILKALKG